MCLHSFLCILYIHQYKIVHTYFFYQKYIPKFCRKLSISITRIFQKSNLDKIEKNIFDAVGVIVFYAVCQFCRMQFYAFCIEQ